MRGNPDKWFDGCDSFLLGMGKVMRYYDGEKMYNMVNLNGELVSDMWFQDITATHNNNCVVTNAEGLQNILTSNKKLFFKTWKKEIPFYDGVYGCVQDTDEQYIVFKDKKVLFKTSYKLFMHFPNNTFAGCGFKGYDIFFNFVDEKGNVLSSVNVAYGTSPEFNGELPKLENNAQYTYEYLGWIVDGVTYYSDWSNKAYRTAK